MNKPTGRRAVNALMLPGALISVLSIANASEPSVLNPSDHPQSPTYESAFPGAIIPIDSRLSWTQRFNGNENFNDDVELPQTGRIMSKDPAMMGQPGTEPLSTGNTDAIGVVKSVKRSQGKIKIEHGPIEKFAMPSMTMVFRVEDPAILDDIENNQQIGFDVDNSSGGFVVTRLIPADQLSLTSDSEPMDARGVVQALRLSQGKVKIEHGPIERLGMPAMTMMFKVDNPQLLEGIAKGAAVEFNIDNSSGGFVITDIAPVKDAEENHATD